MADTLKTQLERLHSLEERADALEIKVEKKEFIGAKVRILREFYVQDPLAYAVAGEKDSYKIKIQFIEDKYSTFLKRALMPKKDEAFDTEVLRVLGSMNGVGEYRTCVGYPLYSEQVTTIGIRKSIRCIDLLALGAGSIFGLVGSLLAYGTPECYRTAMECYEHVTESAFLASFASMMLPMFYGMAKFNHCVSMSAFLDNLRDAAQKTDEFLRKNYV